MTTSPVMTVTDELLAEIMLDCEDSELYQFGEYHVALPTARVVALVEHIRSLTERLKAAEKDAGRYRWLRGQHDSNDSDYAVMKFSKRANEWLHLDWKLDAEIDSAIAHEVHSHE